MKMKKFLLGLLVVSLAVVPFVAFADDDDDDGGGGSSESYSESYSESDSESYSESYSESDSDSESYSESDSDSESYSESDSDSESYSEGGDSESSSEATGGDSASESSATAGDATSSSTSGSSSSRSSNSGVNIGGHTSKTKVYSYHAPSLRPTPGTETIQAHTILGGVTLSNSEAAAKIVNELTLLMQLVEAGLITKEAAQTQATTLFETLVDASEAQRLLGVLYRCNGKSILTGFGALCN